MNLWPVEHFCPSVFSRSMLIWKKTGDQKCSTGQRFIFTEVTFYKIHILNNTWGDLPDVSYGEVKLFAHFALLKMWKNYNITPYKTALGVQ